MRVHADARSAAVVDGMGVRAFTYGLHIFLGSKESSSDLELMAHEVAHVVQQQGKPVMQAAGGAHSDVYETEAGRVAQAASAGQAATVEHRTDGARVQGMWPVDEAVQWVEEKAIGFVRQYAPELIAIIEKGPVEYLKEKIAKAINTVFTLLMSPVRALSGLASSLQGHFGNLVAWMRDAARKIAQGDCRPLTEAAEKVQNVVEGIAAPIINDIKKIATATKDYFTGLWEQFGAPAVDFLKRVGGEAWAGIQEFGRSVWDKTAPIRSALSSAWTWIKNKLGIGEGAEGQNGILQWIQAKASEAWEWLKVKLEPIKVPLMIVGGVLLLLSPAGPLLVMGAAVTGLMTGIRWIRENMRKPNGVVDQRSLLERTIIPGIMSAVEGVSGAITKVAALVTGKLTDAATGLGRAAGAAAASVFRFAVSLIQWLADQFIALMRWANDKLMGLAEWIRNGLARLGKFFAPILGVLRKVAEVYMNLMQLPSLVAGALWNMIPACIRDPFVNFLINQILSRIPFFSAVKGVAELWVKLKNTVMLALKKVFKQGDIRGAIILVFKFMLETLGIPPDLVTGIFSKAASALDLITRDPVGFLKNVLLSFKQGFMQFFGNIGKHLFSGVTGWLFGALASAGITVPTELSFKAILRLVMEILGITVDNVLARLAKNPAIGPGGVAKLKKIMNTLTGVWEFFASIINEGPAGMWKQIQQHLSDLWGMVLGYITDWLVGVLIKQATLWLLSFCDPTFIMSIVNSLIAIYRAVMTFMERLREMLEVVNSVLDGIVEIAKGVIARAANALESALARSLPVVIAFLADQCGLSGIASRISEMIGKVQEKIGTVIEKIIAFAVEKGAAILGGIKSAAGAVLEWWRGERKVLVDGKLAATISFEGDQDNATLQIASSPKRGYVLYLDEMKPKMVTDDQKKAHAAALVSGGKLEGIQRDSRPKDLSDSARAALQAKFDVEYGKFQGFVTEMLNGAVLPESHVISWGGAAWRRRRNPSESSAEQESGQDGWRASSSRFGCLAENQGSY